MSAWTTGFMMAIGLAVAPVTAASQPNDAAEPLEPLTIEVVTVNQARIPSASSEMSLRERVAGTGFQVALERHRATFIGEFDDDVETPGPP